MLRGRAIDTRDRPGAPSVAVVNEKFARAFFGTADPIGRHVVNARCSTCEVEIVGVVANTLYGRLRATTFSKAGPPPIIFLSFLQAAWEPVGRGTFELRTAGNPLGVVQAVRDIVRRADARVPMTQVQTQRAAATLIAGYCPRAVRRASIRWLLSGTNSRKCGSAGNISDSRVG